MEPQGAQASGVSQVAWPAEQGSHFPAGSEAAVPPLGLGGFHGVEESEGGGWCEIAWDFFPGLATCGLMLCLCTGSDRNGRSSFVAPASWPAAILI